MFGLKPLKLFLVQCAYVRVYKVLNSVQCNTALAVGVEREGERDRGERKRDINEQ
mgnify:CR=1 FL=1